MQEGIIPPRVGRNQYDMMATVPAYLDFMQSGGHTKSPALSNEHLRLMRARRRKAELQYERMASKLVNADKMRAVMREDYAAVRSIVMDIPADIAPQMVGHDALRMTEILTEHIHAVLNYLADDLPRELSKKRNRSTRQPGHMPSCKA